MILFICVLCVETRFRAVSNGLRSGCGHFVCVAPPQLLHSPDSSVVSAGVCAVPCLSAAASRECGAEPHSDGSGHIPGACGGAGSEPLAAAYAHTHTTTCNGSLPSNGFSGFSASTLRCRRACFDRCRRARPSARSSARRSASGACDVQYCRLIQTLAVSTAHCAVGTAPSPRPSASDEPALTLVVCALAHCQHYCVLQLLRLAVFCYCVCVLREIAARFGLHSVIGSWTEYYAIAAQTLRSIARYLRHYCAPPIARACEAYPDSVGALANRVWAVLQPALLYIDAKLPTESAIMPTPLPATCTPPTSTSAAAADPLKVSITSFAMIPAPPPPAQAQASPGPAAPGAAVGVDVKEALGSVVSAVRGSVPGAAAQFAAVCGRGKTVLTNALGAVLTSVLP